jgi:hypothetical protein
VGKARDRCLFAENTDTRHGHRRDGALGRFRKSL